VPVLACEGVDALEIRLGSSCLAHLFFTLWHKHSQWHMCVCVFVPARLQRQFLTPDGSNWALKTAQRGSLTPKQTREPSLWYLTLQTFGKAKKERENGPET